MQRNAEAWEEYINTPYEGASQTALIDLLSLIRCLDLTVRL
jgi:hypothetical protein